MAGYTFRYGTGGERGRVTAAYKEVRKPAVRIPFRYTAVNHARVRIQYQKIGWPYQVKYKFAYTNVTENTYHFSYPSESGQMSYGIRYHFRVGILPARCYRFQYGEGYGRLYIEHTAVEFMQPFRNSTKERVAIAFPLLPRQVILSAKDVLIPEQMREIGQRIRTIDFPILSRETEKAAGTVDFSLLIREIGNTESISTIDFPFLVREAARAESMIDFSLLIRELAQAEHIIDFSLLIREIGQAVAKTQDFSLLIRQIARAETTKDFSFIIREIAQAEGTEDFSLLIREIAAAEKLQDFSLLIREIAEAEKTKDFSFLIREIAGAERTKDFSFIIREIAHAATTQDFSFLVREIAEAMQTVDFSFVIREIADAVHTLDFSFLIREIASAEKTLDFSFLVREIAAAMKTHDFSFLIRELASAERTRDFSFLIREIARAETTKDFSFLIREIADAARTQDFSFLIREISDAAGTQDFSFLIREIASAETTKNFSFLIREIASAIRTLDFSFIIREISRPEVTENFSFLIREIAKAEDTQNFSFLIREAAEAANVLAFAFIIREMLKEESNKEFVMSDREGAVSVVEQPAEFTDKSVQKEPEEQQAERVIWKDGYTEQVSEEGGNHEKEISLNPKRLRLMSALKKAKGITQKLLLKPFQAVKNQLTSILQKDYKVQLQTDQALQKDEAVEIEDMLLLQPILDIKVEQATTIEQQQNVTAEQVNLLEPEHYSNISESLQLETEKEQNIPVVAALERVPEGTKQSESMGLELTQKQAALLLGLILAAKRIKDSGIDDHWVQTDKLAKDGFREQDEKLADKSTKQGQITNSQVLQKVQDGGQEELEQVWEKTEKEHQAGIKTIEMEKLPDTAQNEEAEQTLEKAEKEVWSEQCEQQAFTDHRVINEGTAEPLMRKEHESKRAAEGEQGERKITKDGFKESKEEAGEKQIERDGKQEESEQSAEKKQRIFDGLIEGNENENLLYRLQEALIEAIENKSLLSREPEGITEELIVSGKEEKTAALLHGLLLNYPELAPIITAMQAYAQEKQGIAETAQIVKRSPEMDLQEAERELRLHQRFWVIGQSEYKDWLILPPHDFDYEGEPIIFDEPEREDYNQYVYPNKFYRRIDRHPIQSGKEMGREETGVSVSILVDIINIYVLMWFKFTQAFWGWTGVEAVTGIVDAIHEYLTLETTIHKQHNKNVAEEYERAYQWLRWHGEQVVLSAREDQNLRGNYYVEVLLERLTQYMLDHHFDVMPIFRDVNKMDEWRASFGRNEEKDIKWVLDKIKGIRHKLLEAKQYEEE